MRLRRRTSLAVVLIAGSLAIQACEVLLGTAQLREASGDGGAVDSSTEATVGADVLADAGVGPSDATSASDADAAQTSEGGEGDGGADAPTEGSIDAPVDAAIESGVVPIIHSVSAPPVVETSKPSPIGASVTGVPGGSLNFAWTSGDGGTYSPAQGAVTLSDAGVGTLATTFDAPAVKGTFDESLTVTSPFGKATQPFSIRVAPPTPFGYPNAFNPAGTSTTGSGYLFGQQFTTASPSTVVRLGFITGASAKTAQLALYSDVGGNPDALVASTAVFSVVNGVNEVAVTSPAALPAGAYWIMTVFSDATLILESTGSNSTIKDVAFSIGTPLPTTFPSATTATVETYNLYAVVLE
jgi:hypothetical protein